jgi:uncharacterized protein (TIGR02611 family)
MAIASALRLPRLSAAQAARLARLTIRQIRRLIVLVVGFTIIIAGIIMIIAPGPAVVFIPLGLAVLASEFVWARRLLKQYKNYAVNFQKMAEQNVVTRPRPFLALFVVLATVAGVLMAIFVSEYNPKYVLAFAGPLFGVEFGWCVLMFVRWRKLRRPAPQLPPAAQDREKPEEQRPDAA